MRKGYHFVQDLIKRRRCH